MAEEKKLNAKLRTEDFGSAGSRRVVRSGRIPAVIYGKKDADPVYVTLDAKEFRMKKHDFTETTLIALDIDGTVKNVFLKDVQNNLLKNVIQHVDFFEVTFGQLLRTKVRVELTGTATGVRDGGVLDQVTHEVEIECFPRHLPEVVTADVSNLGINETLRVGQLVCENVKFLDDPDTAVATVKIVKDEVAAPAEEAAATDAEAK